MYPGLDERTSRLIEDTNRIGIDFLRTDLETGLTFVRIARTTGSGDGRARNFAKALQAYRTILRFLPRVVPSPAEEVEIQMKLEELRVCLKDAGYSSEI